MGPRTPCRRYARRREWSAASARWGHLVTVASLISSIPWGAWLFFIQGDYTLSARLIGIPVLLLVAIPLMFLPEPECEELVQYRAELIRIGGACCSAVLGTQGPDRLRPGRRPGRTPGRRRGGSCRAVGRRSSHHASFMMSSSTPSSIWPGPGCSSSTIVKPHFSRTRSEATLCFATCA